MTRCWREWEARRVIRELVERTGAVPFTYPEVKDLVAPSQIGGLRLRGYVEKVGKIPHDVYASRERQVYRMTQQAMELLAMYQDAKTAG